MPLKRIIPVLLIKNRQLVKTIRFRGSVYVGDPINTVRILNEKNIPELIIIDIAATHNKCEPDYDFISQIAGECSVPLIYGGGINTMDCAKKVFDCGVEKISLNTAAFVDPGLISELANVYGSQSIVTSIDVRKTHSGAYRAFIKNGSRDILLEPNEYACRLQELGCGEILLNSIDRDGTLKGYDTTLIELVSSAVDVPVIACGGAGYIDDLSLAIEHGASAAAAGSIFVFTGKHKAVLISFPSFLV